jgi:hypothetical protein
MQVGTEGVVYSQQAAPTSYEIPIQTTGRNPASPVCITPFGVIFVSS